MSDSDREEANSSPDSEYSDDDLLWDSDGNPDISNGNATGLYNNEPEYLESELQARRTDTSDTDVDSS